MTKYNGSDLTSLNDNLLEKNYAPAYGMAWWQLLQKYMRIDGDVDKQSVTMTIVYRDTKDNGHIRYKTYYIPRPVENNVIAYSIQILDDNRISQQSRGSFFCQKTRNKNLSFSQ